MPSGAPFRFGEIGFAFRIKEGEFHEQVFPRNPMMPIEEPGKSVTFNGYWGEGAPAAQKNRRCEDCRLFCGP